MSRSVDKKTPHNPTPGPAERERWGKDRVPQARERPVREGGRAREREVGSGSGAGGSLTEILQPGTSQVERRRRHSSAIPVGRVHSSQRRWWRSQTVGSLRWESER